MVPKLWKKEMKEGLDIRPTIAITRAHMSLLEMEALVKEKNLEVDGDIVVNNKGELAVTKVAVEPVVSSVHESCHFINFL